MFKMPIYSVFTHKYLGRTRKAGLRGKGIEDRGFRIGLKTFLSNPET